MLGDEVSLSFLFRWDTEGWPDPRLKRRWAFTEKDLSGSKGDFSVPFTPGDTCQADQALLGQGKRSRVCPRPKPLYFTWESHTFVVLPSLKCPTSSVQGHTGLKRKTKTLPAQQIWFG